MRPAAGLFLRRPWPARPQRGSTLLAVLVLLSVMLLGGLAAARMTEVATLSSGNSARRDAALQASEIGVNAGFAAIKGLASAEASVAPWYFAGTLPQGSDGLPVADFDAAPQITQGAYTIAYIAERLCTGSLPVSDVLRQCVVKQVNLPSSATGRETIEPPLAQQFRITVRVSGPKNTRVWVQSMVTKGQVP